MKSRHSIAALALLSVSVLSAQTPWSHIYSSDETSFISMPFDQVKSTSFSPLGGNFKSITVEGPDGAESMDFEIMDKWVIGENVATIYITTEDPIIDISDKTTKYPAKITVDGAGIYDDLTDVPITFRGRGNSTLNYPKKAYNIKFESKTRICDFKKAKSYVLLANWIDGSFMRNYTAFAFANMIGMPYANSCRPVDVYLNGNYKGTYTLTQKAGFNNGSVDLTKEDEANSVMIELDTCDPAAGKMSEYGGFTAQMRLPYQLKDPDAPEDETQAKEWWMEWALDFEDFAEAVAAGTDISGMVDYTTLAKYLMVYNLACNQELNHPKSVILWKTKGGKWQFGPCWDFDWAFGYHQTYVNYDTENNDQAERKAHYEDLVAKCKKDFGNQFSIFYDTDGTVCYWLDMSPGQFDIYVREANNGYLVHYLEASSASPLPSYQSPLLATGKNMQSGNFGNGGEFFLAMIKDNKEFMAEYARIWAEVEPQVKQFLKDFDTYAAELKPSANREVKTDNGRHYYETTNAQLVKDLKAWVKKRVEYISDPKNNYGLY